MRPPSILGLADKRLACSPRCRAPASPSARKLTVGPWPARAAPPKASTACGPSESDYVGSRANPGCDGIRADTVRNRQAASLVHPSSSNSSASLLSSMTEFLLAMSLLTLAVSLGAAALLRGLIHLIQRVRLVRRSSRQSREMRAFFEAESSVPASQ